VDFSLVHPTSKAPQEDWLVKIKFSDWQQPGNIKQTFNSADLLGKRSDGVVSDIAGNNYRLICKYAFGEKQVHLFVCWIGTHAKYDKICKRGEQYTINVY